jgi:aquaporin Z
LLWLIASGIPEYSIAMNGLGQNGFGEFSPAKYSLLSCFVAEVVLTALFQLWLFWVAPILGAIIVVLVWRYGFKNQ